MVRFPPRLLRLDGVMSFTYKRPIDPMQTSLLPAPPLKLDEKDLRILRYLAQRPSTVDEFLSETGLYVNSWAPRFTGLRGAGLIERTGETRLTRYGSAAAVNRLTEAGHEALK